MTVLIGLLLDGAIIGLFNLATVAGAFAEWGMRTVDELIARRSA